MSKVFTIETVVERTFSEFSPGSRDEAVQFHLFSAVDSPNFHWFELVQQQETVRLEAIRLNPNPDKDYHWDWPESYRLVIEKKGKRVEQVIPRGHKGQNLLTLEIAGMQLVTFNHLKAMRRRKFVSLSSKVGRLIRTLRPLEAKKQKQIEPEMMKSC